MEVRNNIITGEECVEKLRKRRWSSALLATVFCMAVLICIPWGNVRPAEPHNPSPAPPDTANGMVAYRDDESGFQLYYPTGWESIPLNPGVELDDDDQNPAQIVQVLLPNDNQDPTADWVEYELDKLQHIAGGTDFQVIPGSPDEVIGGMSWKGGAATFQLSGATVAVQIYATVHNQQAYIINLLTKSMPLTTARQQSFDAILQSFVFVE
jgi:hypothetical protein